MSGHFARVNLRSPRRSYPQGDRAIPTYRVNVNIQYPQTGGPGLNTWHFRHEDIAALDLDGVLGVLQNFYIGIRSFYDGATTISCPDEIIEDPYGSPTYQSVTGWSVLGNGTGLNMPPSDQVVVTWRTASATRSGRGRTFIGPLVSGLLEDNGTIQAGSLQLIRDAAAALVSESLTDGNWAFGVYSRTDSLLRDFTASNVRDRFAVLRSRRD